VYIVTCRVSFPAR